MLIVQQGLCEGLSLVERARAFEPGQTPVYPETGAGWRSEAATCLDLGFKAGSVATP